MEKPKSSSGVDTKLSHSQQFSCDIQPMEEA